MACALALAAAGVLALALPGKAATVGQGEVRVEAGHVVCDAATGTCRADGGVVLRRGTVTLRARTARYDPSTGSVDAAGDVLLTDPTRVVAADAVHATMGGDFEAQDVHAYVKDQPMRLGEVETLDAARALGRNRLTLSGERANGSADGRLLTEGARLTLCDCPRGGAPSWEIRASHADVLPGERAILTWPVLWVTPRFLLVERPVPVLAFPWIYVPLGERQTGLLFPTLSSTGSTGLVLAEPVFVALGPSADATITPEYAFGPGATSSIKVRGPGARLELRAAPAQGAAGRIELDWLDDLDAEPGGERGSRVALTGLYAQRVSGAATLRVDLGLYGDPLYTRDFTADVLARDAFYRRSDALLSWRAGPAVLEATAAYYDPLSSQGQLEQVPYGAAGARVPVFHRWPALAATLLPTSFAGPIAISGRAGISRFAPMSGYTSDGGMDGIGPGDRFWAGVATGHSAPGEGDRRWEPGERLATTRGDVRAEVSAPLVLASLLSVEPYLRGVAVGYAFDAARDPVADAWGVAGARLWSEISRTYGEVRHAIAPRIEWRAGTGMAGGALPVAAYDQWDRPPTLQVETVDPILGLSYPSPDPRVLGAAPPGAFQQLRGSIESRLSRGSADVLKLEIGQDADLRSHRFAETWAAATAQAGPLALDALVRFWAIQDRPQAPAIIGPGSWLDRFSLLRASAAVRGPRGEVHAGLLAIGRGGSPDLLAGTDTLFDVRPVAYDAIGQGSAGARVVVGPATIGYDALLVARPTSVPACNGVGNRDLDTGHVQQQTASFTWDSPCRCFRFVLTAGRNDCGGLSGGAMLDLSRLAPSVR